MHFLQIVELQTQKHRGQSLTQYFCFRKLVIFWFLYKILEHLVQYFALSLQLSQHIMQLLISSVGFFI